MELLISLGSLAVALVLASIQIIKHVRESRDEERAQAAALILAPAEKADLLVSSATKAVELLERQLNRSYAERETERAKLCLEIEDLKRKLLVAESGPGNGG